MKYQHLMELSSYLEKFETIEKEDTYNIADFAQWLLQETKTKDTDTLLTQNENTQAMHKQTPEVQISILIGRMAKYVRVYTKKILSDTRLSGLDDYSFMATLMFNESMTKSELTHHNLMDSNTSGADIIKRLIKNNYIKEEADVNDKRSKRVKITSTGHLLMAAVFKEMDLASKIIAGNLNGFEKEQLLQSLQKLDKLHQHIYDTDRKQDLKTIKKKYMPLTE
jgi:DNA-binding MarR family transcriptional regulator